MAALPQSWIADPCRTSKVLLFAPRLLFAARFNESNADGINSNPPSGSGPNEIHFPAGTIPAKPAEGKELGYILKDFERKCAYR